MPPKGTSLLTPMDRKERTTMEETIRDHARRLIIRAAARLVEMENMNAPDQVLCSLISSINRHVPLLKKGYSQELEKKLRLKYAKAKNSLGFCCEDNCENLADKSRKDPQGFAQCKSCRQNSQLQLALLEVSELESKDLEMAR